MSANSKIEWTDHTFNPWIGCTKVSPACDHCYAERSTPARTLSVMWGPKAERRRTAPANWALPRRWNDQHHAFFAQHGRRQRVFCASFADVFDNAVDPAWRADFFDLIYETPNLDWLLLTKRIGMAWKLMADACGVSIASARLPLANVWIGATVTDQAEADRDIPKLLAVPAHVRFLSMEPLLGPVDLTDITLCRNADDEERFDALCFDGDPDDEPDLGTATLDWVIVGGESGPGARPMHPDWARSLRDQCEEAGVPFLFKQWGEWTPGENVERVRGTVDTAFYFNGGWQTYPLNLATDHGHIDDQPDLYRVGKKAAGRLLDGRTHDGVPS